MSEPFSRAEQVCEVHILTLQTKHKILVESCYTVTVWCCACPLMSYLQSRGLTFELNRNETNCSSYYSIILRLAGVHTGVYRIPIARHSRLSDWVLNTGKSPTYWSLKNSDDSVLAQGVRTKIKSETDTKIFTGSRKFLWCIGTLRDSTYCTADLNSSHLQCATLVGAVATILLRIFLIILRNLIYL